MLAFSEEFVRTDASEHKTLIPVLHERGENLPFPARNLSEICLYVVEIIAAFKAIVYLFIFLYSISYREIHLVLPCSTCSI